MSTVADKVIEKINSLLSPLVLFIILCAVALLLLIFLIVMICQGVRISKLKKENAELKTALEKERANKRIAEQKAAEQESQAQQSQQTPQAQVGEVKWAENDKPAETQTANSSDEDEDEYIEVVEKEPAKEKPATQFGQPKKTFPQPKSSSALTPQPTAAKYIVSYDKAKESWTIKKAGADRALRRVATKEEAMLIARDLSRKTGATLVVHKKDGKFQRQ